MNPELSYLRQIFDSITSDRDLLDVDIKNDVDIFSEVYRLKQNIHSQKLDKYSENSYYFSAQVSSITRLIMELEDTLQGKSFVKEKEKILNTILINLQELLEYLWKYYPDNFDLSTLVSAIGIERFLAEEKYSISECTEIIDTLEISEELKKIVNQILILGLPSEVDYNSLRFAKELMNYIFNEHKSNLTDENIITALVVRQFNHPMFFEFCKMYISERLTKLSVISDHFRELIYTRKNLLQNFPLNVKPYSPRSETIHDALLKIIDSELDFIKELDFLNTELINSGLLDSNYKVSLSVKQLAFYVFLNVEAGIITEQKATRIHQYVINHVSTAEKQEISEKSFSNGYYVHSPEDIRKVSDKLARMLAIAQEKY